MADLKPPLTGYSLWFLAADEQQRMLQALVDGLAESFQTPRFIAHATLLGLLDFIPSHKPMMEMGASTLADNCPLFELEVIGVGRRDAYFQSVFLSAVPSSVPVDCNNRARYIFNKRSGLPFMPHFSALYGDVTRTIKDAAQEEIRSNLQFPLMIPIDRIALVDNHGHPPDWKIVAEFPLSG